MFDADRGDVIIITERSILIDPDFGDDKEGQACRALAGLLPPGPEPMDEVFYYVVVSRSDKYFGALDLKIPGLSVGKALVEVLPTSEPADGSVGSWFRPIFHHIILE
jgi:hypothetical protein